jgi:chromosome condensin MukBEF ATPase and DNA-binding subunit MukB
MPYEDRTTRQLKETRLEIQNYYQRSNNNMDRITEKLKHASGVVQRATIKLESEADRLIARAETIDAKISSAFAPHHAALDERNRELDQLEAAPQILSNIDPLAGSGDAGASVQPPIRVALGPPPLPTAEFFRPR